VVRVEAMLYSVPSELVAPLNRRLLGLPIRDGLWFLVLFVAPAHRLSPVNDDGFALRVVSDGCIDIGHLDNDKCGTNKAQKKAVR
jgi:hypothetical protein